MKIVEKVLFIPICCVCDKVRDDEQSRERPTGSGLEQWLPLRSFLRLYGITGDAYRLTHTYCPRCMEHLGYDRKKSEHNEPLQEELGGGSSRDRVCH